MWHWPVLISADAVEADWAVCPEEHHHVAEHIEQQRVWGQLGGAGKGVVQVWGAGVQSQLEDTGQEWGVQSSAGQYSYPWQVVLKKAES